MHPKSKILIDNTLTDCISPYIISASRATDIPAYYSNWFFKALDKGYCFWKNPFNKKTQLVSFQNCRAVIFWTKNPEPIISQLHKLDERNIHYYFLFSLNDYDKEGIEKNTPSLSRRIKTFIKLSEKIGREKVLWRYDPILVSDTLSAETVSNRIKKIADKIYSHTNKLIFSFIEIEKYKKTHSRIKPYSIRELNPAEKIICLQTLAELKKDINKHNSNFEIASCAIAHNYEEYGIKHNKCIDDELLYKIAPNDKILSHFLGKDNLFPAPSNTLKDKGQRPACGCIISKDIGQYSTCRHACAYCYANGNKITPMKA